MKFYTNVDIITMFYYEIHQWFFSPCHIRFRNWQSIMIRCTIHHNHTSSRYFLRYIFDPFLEKVSIRWFVIIIIWIPVVKDQFCILYKTMFSTNYEDNESFAFISMSCLYLRFTKQVMLLSSKLVITSIIPCLICETKFTSFLLELSFISKVISKSSLNVILLFQ